MHLARWAIYSLKIRLLQALLKINPKYKQNLQDVSLFIATSYVKSWLGCGLSVKAPNYNLCFLKTLKQYETIDKLISEAALSKFSQHLWYLSDVITVMALFDDKAENQVKIRLVYKLQCEKS